MKLNKIILAAIISIVATSAIAAEPKSTKAKANKPAAAVAVAEKVAPKATGPVSFGAIKLGMTKAQIEALTAQDSFYLQSPMTLYVYPKNSTPIEGVDKFDGALITPYRTSTVPSVFTFKNDALTSFYIDLEKEESLADELQKMVEKKYGQPKIDDSMKEEQCLYKNGSNFKIKSGLTMTTWTQELADSTDVITTSFTDMRVAMCPSSLRNTFIDMKLRSFSLNRGSKPTPKPEAF